MLNSITKLGKYLFLIPFLMFGISHLTKANDMTPMVPLPGGSIWVYLTGLGMLGFVASALIGKFDKLAAVLTAVMCLVFALSVHLPGVMNGTNAMGIISLLKDVGLAGGALMYAGAYARDNSLVG
jgi:putative oxidoreductase